MPNWLNKFIEGLGNILNSIMKTLDNLSLKIKETTGINVNLSLVVVVIIVFIFFIFVCKSILGWVASSL